MLAIPQGRASKTRRDRLNQTIFNYLFYCPRAASQSLGGRGRAQRPLSGRRLDQSVSSRFRASRPGRRRRPATRRERLVSFFAALRDDLRAADDSTRASRLVFARRGPAAAAGPRPLLGSREED